MTPERAVDAGLAAIVVRHVDGALLASLTGELDVSNVKIVQSSIVAAMDRVPRLLVLDFSETRYIDSSSVAMVVGFSVEMATKRGHLAVVAAPGSPAGRVFHFSGVSDSLDLHDEVTTALQSSPGVPDKLS